jgi:hypothetical protein
LYLIEVRRSGRRRRWLKAKVEAPLVAGDSVKELSEVNNGVGGGIAEPVQCAVSLQDRRGNWVRRRVGKCD